MNLFHRHFHEWTEYQGSHSSRAVALRVCNKDNCGRTETCMWDHNKKRLVWVEGNFFENVKSPVFVIAESREAIEDAIRYIPLNTGYYIAKKAYDLENMKSYTTPRFFLGKDWKETEISDTDDFRLLVMTGHF